MHDPTRLPPQQRLLPFARPDLWNQLPEEARRQCQELCQQLLRTILVVEEPPRRSYERKDSHRPS
jgi:hypothetical protein